MSRFTINSNIASLSAQRRLGESTNSLRKSFTRLSSGLRINRASDDAAGLSIASALETDRRVYAQGIRNLNEGLSLLSTADAAIGELTNVVTRLRELAQQSANGSLSNTQREAIDTEAQALREEFTRIAQSTEFGGVKLLDGSLGDGVRLQVGYGEQGGITARIGGSIADGTFAEATSYATNEEATRINYGDFNNDGNIDLVASSANFPDRELNVLFGNGDGTFGNEVVLSSTERFTEIAVEDINNDGNMDLLAIANFANQISVRLGAGDGTFGSESFYRTDGGPTDISLSDLNGDGILDVAVSSTDNSRVSIMIGNGDGSFGARSVYSAGASTQSVTLADVDNDGDDDFIASAVFSSGNAWVALNNGDGTFAATTVVSTGGSSYEIESADFNQDGNIDLVVANTAQDSIRVLLGRGDGTFNPYVGYTVGDAPRNISLGDIDGDGITDIATTNDGDGTISFLIGDGNGSFSAGVSVSSASSDLSDVLLFDADNDGNNDLVYGDTASKAFSVQLANTSDGVASLADFSLATQASARSAMAPLENRLAQLASQRATIGSYQSRIEVAISAAQISVENFDAARSRIEDIDVASEAAELTRLNIIQNAATAILAQANIQPQLALALLNNTR